MTALCRWCCLPFEERRVCTVAPPDYDETCERMDNFCEVAPEVSLVPECGFHDGPVLPNDEPCPSSADGSHPCQAKNAAWEP